MSDQDLTAPEAVERDEWKRAYEVCALDTLTLTHRAEAAEAKLKEAVDVATRLADWIEHEAGCELPFDARAVLRDIERDKP